MRASAASSPLSWFGLSYTTFCAALIFFGFSFTVISEVIEQARPAVLYVHILSAAAWLILVVVQAGLARSRKLALHRRIGRFGFPLGALAAFSAFITSFVLRHESVIRHGDDHRIARIAFLSIPLNTAITFSVLLGCAYFWRHKPAIHRRCMMFAAAVLTLPAVARIPIIGEADLLSLLPTDILVLALIGLDLARERRLHPVTLFAAPAIIALQFVSGWLFAAQPDWWVSLSSFLIGV